MICCRGSAAEALAATRSMMERLKLTVNESKTRLVRVPEQSVDFLGYTIVRFWSPRTGRSYIGVRPAKTRVQRVCREISEMTSRRWFGADAEDRVECLNRLLAGWAN